MKTPYKWSVDDYHQMIEWGLLVGKPVELLEGAIVEMGPEGIPYSYTCQSVSDYLRELFKGKVYLRDSHPITLDNSEPEPDIVIVRLPHNIYAKHHPYPEDIYWLVEISDKTLAKDLEEKSLTYARNNIPESWVIDLVNNKVVVSTNPRDNQYQDRQEFTTGIIRTLAFPDLAIAVNKLLLLPS